MFDFDTLLEQLGGRTQPKEEWVTPAVLLTPAPSALDAVQLTEDDADPFSRLERQLRETEAPRPDHAADLLALPSNLDGLSVARADQDRDHDQRLMADLEDWLSAILVDREQRPSA